MVVGVARRERRRNGDNLRVIADGEQLEGGKEGPMTATPSLNPLHFSLQRASPAEPAAVVRDDRSIDHMDMRARFVMQSTRCCSRG